MHPDATSCTSPTPPPNAHKGYQFSDLKCSQDLDIQAFYPTPTPKTWASEMRRLIEKLSDTPVPHDWCGRTCKESLIRKQMGWSPNSNIIATYEHLANTDLKTYQMRQSGELAEEVHEVELIKPKESVMDTIAGLYEKG
jgi:hypothetical protein